MRPSTKHATAALLVVGGLFAAGCGSSGDTTTSTTATITTMASTTTTVGAPVTDAPTTTASADEQPDSAVWPFASTSTRYSDPVEAATGFATDFLGFVDPIVGDFEQGDTRSGEVTVRVSDPGPITTVLVRQMGPDDSWWVLGATTPNLEISVPDALTTVTSGLTISGMSTAFEGTIDVELRADGQAQPVVAGNTMGGSMGEMKPFSIGMTFVSAPTVSGGAIVVKTMSAKDGNIAEASVIRIHF